VDAVGDGLAQLRVGEVVDVHRRRLDGPGRPGEDDYRLITTLLDHQQAPAAELAALHPERRECETMPDELKTHQRGGKSVVLASKTPDGIRQEIYARLLVHHALRALTADAVREAPQPVDCDRLSFTTALRAARRTVTCTPGAFPPDLLHRAWQHFCSEVRDRLPPPRRPRSQPRVVKRKMSGYRARTSHHRNRPQPNRTPAEAVQVLPP
jgi:hypothetical protein